MVNVGRYEEGHGFDIIYPDSSTIFFASSTGHGSPTADYYEACARCFTTYDTLVSGVQPNGRLWKEYVVGNTSLGYHDVPRARQRLYDQALTRFRPKIRSIH